LCLTLPEAVNLTLLLKPLWVFCFGILADSLQMQSYKPSIYKTSSLGHLQLMVKIISPKFSAKKHAPASDSPKRYKLMEGRKLNALG